MEIISNFLAEALYSLELKWAEKEVANFKEYQSLLLRQIHNRSKIQKLVETL